MNNENDNLRREIHEVFAWRPYPGDEDLGRSGPGWHYGEEVAAVLRGKHWQTLVIDDILDSEVAYDDFFASMTKNAFVYYLPAFLTMSLDIKSTYRTRKWSFEIVENVILYLTDPDYTPPIPDALKDDPLFSEPPSPAMQAWFSYVTASLTHGEKIAVAHTLAFLSQEYERLGFSNSDDTNSPKQALTSYWGRFQKETDVGEQGEG